MKNKIAGFVFILQASFLCAQTSTGTAKAVIAAAAAKTSVEQSVEYLKKTIPEMSVSAEKRIVYTFLGEIQEQMGNFSDAQKSYASAAGIQGSAPANSSEIPYKNSEQLVVDAIRCALCAGDYTTTDSYLNSAVRNSKDAVILARIKLYEQWSALCKVKKESETKEIIAMLKTYADLDSMKPVKASVLLTLWHLTGESSFADRLKKGFPGSMEASVVRGEVQILPTPFWYFVPRSGVDIPEIKNEFELPSQQSDSSQKNSGTAAEQKPSSSKVVRQQLGLFKDKANAQALADKVKAKGFDAKIENEVRPSGTTYYIVIVQENSSNTVGKELKTAGFECYPVFE